MLSFEILLLGNCLTDDSAPNLSAISGQYEIEKSSVIKMKDKT